MTTEPLITSELLKSWNACEDWHKRFNELFPNGETLPLAIDGLVADDNDDLGYWLFCKARDNRIYDSFILRGYQNSGDWNSGDCNSGDQNSGDCNSGDRNSGDCNSGDRNSGDCNSGDWNSGGWNSGDRNSGGWNSGYRNSGYQNSGDWNSGDRNSGYRNSGDWNSGDCNSGFFNTDKPAFVRVFGKDVPRSVWESAYKPSFLFFDLIYWVDEKDMTDEEKAADPSFFVRGGQLRKRDYKEAFKMSWDKADPVDRMKVTELPNFDAGMFFKISGIRVGEKK